jgi:hypothetical protein
MAEADLPPFPPPMRFGDFDDPSPLSATPPHGGMVNGYPYDLIDNMPLEAIDPPTTSFAMGGAVHYSGGRGGPSTSYPLRDRGYYYKVNETECLSEVYWGNETSPEYYVTIRVKQDKAHLWGYGENGTINFQGLAQDGEGASLEVWDTSDSANAKYVKIKTDDFPANPSEPLFVKLREIEICEKDDNGNPYKILVLCSQKYSTQGG